VNAKQPGPGGIVVVDKPAGLTSHDVVARVRRLAGTRKVGHAGTLDPMATGVLIVGLERTTRLLGHLAGGEKCYEATIRFGESTDTDDATGTSTGRHDPTGLSAEVVRAAALQFTGTIMQVPAQISAIKVAGERAYKRVRAGEDVELTAREVTVSQFDLGELRPADGLLDVDAVVTCSSGTYIRALARDLGAALGCGAHLTRLRRTRVGPFGIAQARTLQEHQDELAVVPLDRVAEISFPVRRLDATAASIIAHGGWIPAAEPAPEGAVAAFDPSGRFIALLGDSRGRSWPITVFVGPEDLQPRPPSADPTSGTDPAES
jgi:tRNA pseudouridine55 synthase